MSVSEVIKKYKLFNQTLEDYFPSSEVKTRGVKVLDAMCGGWFYSDTLLAFLDEKFKCNHLLGVDNDYRLMEFKREYSKPVEFKLMKIENIKGKHDESFDIITNFRPNCHGLKAFPLKPVYKRLNQLLKKEGTYFGTTYWKEEMAYLQDLLKTTGFKITGIHKNKNDPFEHYHGWIITAKKQ